VERRLYRCIITPSSILSVDGEGATASVEIQSLNQWQLGGAMLHQPRVNIRQSLLFKNISAEIISKRLPYFHHRIPGKVLCIIKFKRSRGLTRKKIHTGIRAYPVR
jgi:hypothetical protein